MTRAKGPRHRVPFRRRREKKTDYYSRKRTVLSRRNRLVIRPSTRHVTAQVVEAHPKSDITLASSHSSELSSFGWKGGTGNLPAAYLTGLILGLRARSKGVESAVLDVGVKKPVAGSRTYATLKGALDAGLIVPHREDVFAKEDRFGGKHIASYGALLVDSEEATYQRRFSRLLSQGVSPEKITDLFESTRSSILESFEDDSKT
ncbi:MAG: 50S ribosomal protein L18 [Candidatus Bathyarchaeota archaeon]|nr:MAG: 50S ribosomal protein L18 [Candidatus Bathyarchaeota archaeon]